MSKRPPRITPIILAGGKGTRLWPLSRSARPKQFLPLTGERSLFQQTLLRFADNDQFDTPVIVTNEEYRFLVAEQAMECGVKLDAILLEPMVRNTAAAISVGSLFVKKHKPKQLALVLPSDHDIDVDEKYLSAINAAKTSALAGKLATFGITPTEPSTGFGYIEVGKKQTEGAYSVKKFVEKPNLEKAKKMLETGKFFWNSGMFLFSVEVFLKECERLAPDVCKAAQKSLEQAKSDLDFIRLDAKGFANAPDISVDYAIFEKTNLASVIPSKIKWSDLGSWSALWAASNRDSGDNFQKGPISLSETSRSLVVSEKLHVAVHGLDDIAVVASEDAVYVGRLSQSQEVGAVVRSLKNNQNTSHLTEVHQTSYRPWGGYSSVLLGERFQVKRLFVKSGKKLSLQKHHHRSEHWIIVKGTAEVRVGDKVQVLRENESIYIPQGSVHRLSNPGKILLELIEVQTGSYLGEDDIIRLEDDFGRD